MQGCPDRPRPGSGPVRFQTRPKTKNSRQSPKDRLDPSSSPCGYELASERRLRGVKNRQDRGPSGCPVLFARRCLPPTSPRPTLITRMAPLRWLDMEICPDN